VPSDPRDYKLEITSLPAPEPEPVVDGRPWLSVLFSCCGVYQRVYKQPDRDEYLGRCPRCTRSVRFIVGEGGTSSRIFVVE